VTGRYIDTGAYLAFRRSVGGSADAQARFVRDFVALWRERADRLTDNLDRRDLIAADITLLSIRSSSTMIGAVVLDAICGLIHTAVDRGDLEAARVHLERFREVGEATCGELTERYRSEFGVRLTG